MVMANIQASRLRIEFETGQADGELEIEGKNFNNIHPQASDEAVYEAGMIISSLQSYPLYQLERRNDKMLSE